jgi:hypothetical protein
MKYTHIELLVKYLYNYLIMTKNVLDTHKHILVCIDEQLVNVNVKEFYKKQIDYLKENFCGIIISDIEIFNNTNYSPNTLIYLCGNIEANYDYGCNYGKNMMIYVIRELSYNYSNNYKGYKLVNIGKVPINIYGMGVYFRDFFESDNFNDNIDDFGMVINQEENQNKDYFNLISNEHKLQFLTESNKPGVSLRKGIYLTKVEENNDSTYFHLLRCSTNLNGPTDNFRDTDIKIIGEVNDISRYFYGGAAELNHVLAQVYENTDQGGEHKNLPKKAKIKQHSDKTKDMPQNALMAFCTFYQGYSNREFSDEKLKNIKRSTDNPYDYCYKNQSILTKLRFRLKETVTDLNLVKKFDITLYPNSVFIMSLLTNRLYTHKIVPSIMPINKIPIRLGYVIRCSKTKAVFKDNKTFIVEEGDCIELKEPSEDNIKELKDAYYKENITDQIINYGNIYFSMNLGDYKKPLV